MSNVKAALDVIASKAPGFKADVAMVLGSGLGGVIDAVRIFTNMAVPI